MTLNEMRYYKDSVFLINFQIQFYLINIWLYINIW